MIAELIVAAAAVVSSSDYEALGTPSFELPIRSVSNQVHYCYKPA